MSGGRVVDPAIRDTATSRRTATIVCDRTRRALLTPLAGPEPQLIIARVIATSRDAPSRPPSGDS